MTTSSTSLIDMILALLRDPQQKALFDQNPEAYVASCGDFTPDDVRDAITLADDDRGDRDSHVGGSHNHHVPPPPPHHGGSDHDSAVRYLQTYVNNTYETHNTTTIDDSLHQHVDTHGGDFDQDIDNHQVVASGEGSVAAGGNITGTTTTGNDNMVGQGNVRGEGNVVGHDNQAVTGNDDTTSFGSGAVNSSHVGGSVSTGDGSAYSGTSTAAATTTDTSQHDSHNDASNHAIDHSYNPEADNSHHDDNSLHDSLNDDHAADTHTHSDVADSHNITTT